MNNTIFPGEFEHLEVIDSFDHLSEIIYYHVSDAELGEMAYYEALGDYLAEETSDNK